MQMFINCRESTTAITESVDCNLAALGLGGRNVAQGKKESSKRINSELKELWQGEANKTKAKYPQNDDVK